MQTEKEFERIGKHNFDVIKECVDGVITVSIDELCAAVKDIFEDTRVLLSQLRSCLSRAQKYATKFQINVYWLLAVEQMLILKDLAILLKI